MYPVGGYEQASGGDLLPYLLLGEVRFPLRYPSHLGRHPPEPRVLELSYGLES